MKSTIAFIALVACVVASPVYQDNDVHHSKKQQDVWEIVKYIHNPIYNKEHLEIAKAFSLEANAQHYKNDAVQYFNKYFKHGYLKKGEIFSIYDETHVQQAKALFKLFYYAENYDVFYNTALWARYHLNEDLAMYCYFVAIVHRPDTQGLVLPPIHELIPHYFFPSEVIQKAYHLKMTHFGDSQHQNQEYTIHSNYSGHYLNLHPEQSLSYYLEDVGLNSFYFYVHLYFPYWMDSAEFHLEHHSRGEIFYFIHKQLLARYYLERLSHGVGDIESFSWDLPFKTGYNPSLTYANGLAFPERPHYANLREYIQHYTERRCGKMHHGHGYHYVQKYEHRLKEAVDSGYVIDLEGKHHDIYSEEGINLLGNIIEGNSDSINPRYYGHYIHEARHLLGYAKEPLDHHKLAPSALEHLSTSLRDPAFYQLYKKVLDILEEYKENLPSYHHDDLQHHGLDVAHVEVEPLVTYYDHFLSDITNGLFVTPEEYVHDSFRVKVHQYRLNHKNFNYKIHVKADKEVSAVVKVFIGPKHDEHGRDLHLCQVHDRMFEIDHFVHKLHAGENVISRNSAESCGFSKDRTSYYDAYRYIMGEKHLEVPNKCYHHHGLPLRFKLPRGSEAGISFQLYVIAYPYTPYQQSEDNHVVDNVHHHIDNYPLGWPFDRPCANNDVYHVPNAYVKNVKVYHKIHAAVGSIEDSFGVDHDYHKYQYQHEDLDNSYDQLKEHKFVPQQNYKPYSVHGWTNKYSEVPLKSFLKPQWQYSSEHQGVEYNHGVDTYGHIYNLGKHVPQYQWNHKVENDEHKVHSVPHQSLLQPQWQYSGKHPSEQQEVIYNNAEDVYGHEYNVGKHVPWYQWNHKIGKDDQTVHPGWVYGQTTWNENHHINPNHHHYSSEEED